MYVTNVDMMANKEAATTRATRPLLLAQDVARLVVGVRPLGAQARARAAHRCYKYVDKRKSHEHVPASEKDHRAVHDDTAPGMRRRVAELEIRVVHVVLDIVHDRHVVHEIE